MVNEQLSLIVDDFINEMNHRKNFFFAENCENIRFTIHTHPSIPIRPYEMNAQ